MAGYKDPSLYSMRYPISFRRSDLPYVVAPSDLLISKGIKYNVISVHRTPIPGDVPIVILEVKDK